MHVHIIYNVFPIVRLTEMRTPYRYRGQTSRSQKEKQLSYSANTFRYCKNLSIRNKKWLVLTCLD